MIDYKQITNGLRGINNTLCSVAMTRAEEEKYLYEMFFAQQPRLKDKIEHAVQLEQLVFNILEDKYVLRPQMVALSNPDSDVYDPAEYRKAYNTAIKVQDLIGRSLGRLGLTLRPQAYIPVADRENFDPKAKVSLQNKVAGLIDSVKSEESEKDA